MDICYTFTGLLIDVYCPVTTLDYRKEKQRRWIPD